MTRAELQQKNKVRLHETLNVLENMCGELLLCVGIMQHQSKPGEPFCTRPEEMTDEECATILRHVADRIHPFDKGETRVG